MGPGREKGAEEKREGKKIGAPGRGRLLRARAKKKRERGTRTTRHGTATGCVWHTRACTRAKYGRPSFASSPFSAPSAFVTFRVRAYVRACVCERDITFSLFLTRARASHKWYSQAPSKFAPVSAVVSTGASLPLFHHVLLVPRRSAPILPAPPRLDEN